MFMLCLGKSKGFVRWGSYNGGSLLGLVEMLLMDGILDSSGNDNFPEESGYV